MIERKFEIGGKAGEHGQIADGLHDVGMGEHVAHVAAFGRCDGEQGGHGPEQQKHYGSEGKQDAHASFNEGVADTLFKNLPGVVAEFFPVEHAGFLPEEGVGQQGEANRPCHGQSSLENPNQQLAQVD